MESALDVPQWRERPPAAIAAQLWWSWGESNPRPKAFVRQIYTLSWLVWF
jgi:hypothetical protein